MPKLDHSLRVTAGHSCIDEREAMARYEISVKGRLDPSLLNDLGSFESDEHPAVTVLRGPLAGQDALRRLLTQLQARGLELVEVRQLDSDEPDDA